jgi:hypothetical protein
MKRSANKKLESLERTYVREINAKFASRLPNILDEISESLMVIEPAVNDVAVPLQEFVDFLDFEIEKTKLQIQKDAWKSIVDLNKAAEDDIWLEHLEQLRKDFDVEKMTSSVNFIRTMVDRVKQTFQLRKRGPPAGGP